MHDSSSCALCGGALEPRYDVRDLVLETEGTWTYAECAACGHGQLAPLPGDDELGALYRGLYSPENLRIMETVGTSWFEQGLHRTRLKLIAAARPQVTCMLDVGCGLGFWLKAVGARFPDAERTGLDMSPQASARARATAPDATVLEAAFDDEAPAGPFDLVTLEHVLEHVPDPRTTLTRAYARLAPGGVLQLEVPWKGGWGRRLFRRWYWGHLPPQHLHLFGWEGLEALLREVGLEPVARRTTSYPFLAVTTLVLAVRYTVGSRSRHARNWLVRGPVVLAGFSVLPSLLLFDAVMGPLLGWLGQGDVLTVVARRPESGSGG